MLSSLIKYNKFVILLLLKMYFLEENLMEVKIINRSKNENPTYATEGASGFDLRANLDEDLMIKPLERVAVPTGLFLEIP